MCSWRLTECWEDSLSNLLQTGIMPQPRGSPTLFQYESGDEMMSHEMTEKVDGGTSGRDSNTGDEIIADVHGGKSGRNSLTEDETIKDVDGKTIGRDSMTVNEMAADVDGGTSTCLTVDMEISGCMEIVEEEGRRVGA